MARYKGYSSENYEKNGTFLLTDIELVKYDFLNYLFTRKGDRVRMPGYGTIIADLVFEPLDDFLLNQLQDEILRAVEQEPRFDLIDLSVVPDYDLQSVTVNIVVQYIEFNVTGNINFNIQFTEA